MTDNSPITDERVAELRRLAEAAVTVEPLEQDDIAFPGCVTYWAKIQRAYIAATNPKAILSLLDALEALKERAEKAEKAEWRPIETAPKEPLNSLGEGRTILLCGGFAEGDGRPSIRTGHWKAVRTNAWCDTALGRCARAPTHWMPLPTPPTTSQDTQQGDHRYTFPDHIDRHGKGHWAKEIQADSSLQKMQIAPAAPEKAAEPKCETCEGRGEVCWFVGTPGSGCEGFETHCCPDCRGTGRRPGEVQP